MRHVLVIEDSSLRLLAVPGEPGLFEFLEYRDAEDVRRLLGRYQFDSVLLARLRQHVASEQFLLDPYRLTNTQIASQVADLVASQRLPLARHERPRFTLAEGVTGGASDDSTATPKKKLTWIEIVVIDDVTGQPVPWVRMAVKLPSGDESFYTTDNEGLIRIDDIDPGTFDARCDLRNATLGDTLAFVSMGEKTDEPTLPSDAFPSDNTTRRLAEIEAHKVKSGETLESLAQKAGMTWQDLAKFNWDTDAPAEINDRLRDDVGCTHKTQDGTNYVLDDSDDPGMVFIPSKWEQTGLATGRTHTVRVKPIAPPCLLYVRLDVDPADAQTHDDRFILSSSDGAYRSEKTVKDDRLPGDHYVDLRYTRLDPAKEYTLEAVAAPGEPAVRLYENVAYSDLAGLSPAVPATDQEQTDPHETQDSPPDEGPPSEENSPADAGDEADQSENRADAGQPA
jgi:hypothetical protein